MLRISGYSILRLRDSGQGRDYLSHIFRAVTGTNIREYRNELKLTKAKLMLKNTDISIGQIAREVGFESISYFTEVFSKSETISPKEYRELHKRG